MKIPQVHSINFGNGGIQSIKSFRILSHSNSYNESVLAINIIIISVKDVHIKLAGRTVFVE